MNMALVTDAAEGRVPQGRATDTRARIVAVTSELLGTRGIDQVSLDEIAAQAGVRKQTVLYWFGSRASLVDNVIEVTLDELVAEVRHAVDRCDGDALERIDAVVVTIVAAAVRRPHLLGLLRDLRHLPPERAEAILRRLRPVVDTAVETLSDGMTAGVLRPADPGIIVGLLYACVSGVAADPVTLGVVSPTTGPAGLRRLRREIRAFVRSALTVAGSAGGGDRQRRRSVG